MTKALSPKDASANTGPSLQQAYSALKGGKTEPAQVEKEKVEPDNDEADTVVEVANEDDTVEVEVEKEQDSEKTEEIVAEKTQEEEPPRVDIEDPAIRQRMDWLWKTTNESKELSEELTKANKALLERVSELEEKQHKVETDQTLGNLKAQLKEAMEEGDIDRQLDLSDAITDYKAQQMNKGPERQQQEEQPPAQPVLTERDFAIQSHLESLSQETDPHGQFVRPWMQPSHPRYKEAVTITAQQGKQYAATHGEINPVKVMAEVDKLMGLKARQVSSGTVLNSDTGASDAPSNKVKLSGAQVRAAQKMGVSPERYAKLMSTQQTNFRISDLKKK